MTNTTSIGRRTSDRILAGRPAPDPHETARLRNRFSGGYVAFHTPRYLSLLRLLRDLAKPGDRVLDIGNSVLTELIHEELGVTVDNLGLTLEGETAYGHSYWYDLNSAADRAAWRPLGPYDVIVMAEVIEHLHTAPQLVLAYLRSLLTDGGLLLVQTPNAAALHNRLLLLAGRNPYELIRVQSNDPGHFREYTRRELTGLAQHAGFDVVRWSAETYFDYRYARHHGAPDAPARPNRFGAAVNGMFRFAPASFKPGQTLLLRAR